MATEPAVTKDGYEVQFGTNHVGNAALALRLLPIMARTAEKPGSDVRFVALTSLGYRGHPGAGIDFDGLRDANQFPVLGPWVRYGQSKLANILFARELCKRYPNITSVAVHPGIVATDLVHNLSFWNRLLVRATNPMGLITPRQGCYNTVWAATASDVAEKLQGGTRSLCKKSQVALFLPVGVPDAGDARCWDDQLMVKLWDWTVGQVGVQV
jgi:NAD(P)-dependent dehydrogenase (short-subunit alcohol dehydrogenase family)